MIHALASRCRLLAVFTATLLLASTALAAAPAGKPPSQPPDEQRSLAPGGKYVSGDMQRPRPRVVTPPGPSTQTAPGQPPSDAIVLFDGKDLSQWQQEERVGGERKLVVPKWKVENGHFEVVPRTGSIRTKEKFGQCQLHIEWCTPAEVKGRGQGRGNSGVFLPSFGEFQILDSFENDTYPDGQAAALYGRYPPLVNASAKPGEWQTFDIIAQHAKVDEKGKVVRPALLTVLHNGVVVHHAVDFGNRRGESQIGLKDHGVPLRFRNIWLRPLTDYDEGGTPPPAAERK